jgi:peroxiredoxin
MDRINFSETSVKGASMLNKKRLKSIFLNLLVIVLAFTAVSLWQNRNLLGVSEKAPDFSLKSLDGNPFTFDSSGKRKTVLYFFAPWCTVCTMSSHNIVSIRKAYDPEEVAVYAVALSYSRREEVKQFAEEHRLTVPVLLGSENVQKDYKIEAFPTIYIIDQNGEISSRVVGYTTELGLRARLLF